jgi:SnoaL-like domain
MRVLSMANTIDSIVGAYFAAWLEEDGASRIRLLEKSWSEDGIYQDPTVDISGREALNQHIAKFHERLPGHSIVLTSNADHHHGKIHFTWKLLGPNGNTVSEGRDFGELASDGRIRLIAGFFGPPPTLAGAEGREQQSE